MDWAKIFTREENIVGLEISDSHIRLALLELVGKKVKQIEIKKIAFKELSEGVIVNGAIKDQVLFKNILLSLLKDLKFKLRYVILSLSSDNVYSRVYYFPKTFNDEKIKEAMGLAAGFQLPFNIAEVYFDWEKLGDNSVFMAACSKKIVDEYTKALSSAGINIVAIEFYPLSVIRLLDPVENPFLLVIFNSKGASASVIENNIIKFNRFLPYEFFSKPQAIGEELRKIIDFYDAESAKQILEIKSVGPYKETIKLSQKIEPLKMPELFGNFLVNNSVAQSDQWFVSIGAAKRGLVPRSNDQIISLMPIGTEKAYKNQKAMVFTNFLAGLTISLAVFLTIVFVGVFGLMLTLKRNFASRFIVLNTKPLPDDAVAMEAKAQQFNDLLSHAQSYLDKMPMWSKLLDELQIIVSPETISLTAFRASSPAEPVTISGVAKNRTELNSLKKRLEESPMITEVNMQKTNLTLRDNIPFLISFRLKDLSLIYGY